MHCVFKLLKASAQYAERCECLRSRLRRLSSLEPERSNVRKYHKTETVHQERELLANDRAERAVRIVPLLIRSTNPIEREDLRNDSIHR